MELWDVYDDSGALTGRTHQRGQPLAPGDYHLAVSITVVNSRGEVLLTRRSPEKPLMPGAWECTSGSVLAGETSRQGAVRELWEETGIHAEPEELVYLARRVGPDWYMDDYGLRRDVEAEDLVLQPGETDAAQWMPLDEWERKARAGELFAIGYQDGYYAAVRRLAGAPGDGVPAGELLDVYDGEGNRTGRTHRRGAALAPGDFCLVAAVTIFNSGGRVLCTLRSPEKKLAPNTWESPGGTVLAGETSRQGAVRELWEETGIAAGAEELVYFHRRRKGDILLDVYALRWEGSVDELRLQKGETAGARWFPLEEWEEKARSREILAGDDTDEFFAAVRRLAGVKEREEKINADKVGMISLGCAKNQVDGEMLMASLKAAGFELVDDVAMADVAIVNTCGFIASAKKESIDEILELGLLKQEGRIKKLVATGCLAERYQEEMRREIPELDGVFGIGANGDIARYIQQMLDEGTAEAFPEKDKLPLCGERELSTPSWSAYLKIAEGCDNRCTYCAIPQIRGGYRSRTMEDIEREARALAEEGAKELVLIAQDTTRYGVDLYGGPSLAKLLKRLCGIEGIRWLRVLYCYPDVITDELLEVMAQEEKVVPYIDLPLQHCSGRVLKAMNRRGDRASLTALIEKIRAKVPGVILRTTLITGFPGETEEDFTELCEFVKEIGFDRLGCFTYSQEEGTPAASLPDQVEEEVKEHRAEIITEMQMDITDAKCEGYIGNTYQVLVEGFDRYAECWFGRCYMDAPDVDGKVFFTTKGKRPVLGHFVPVVIEDWMNGDLTGSLV